MRGRFCGRTPRVRWVDAIAGHWLRSSLRAMCEVSSLVAAAVARFCDVHAVALLPRLEQRLDGTIGLGVRRGCV